MKIYKNSIINGDCIEVMKYFPDNSIHLIVTDPPYIVRYKSRDGRGVPNDDNDKWLRPAFRQMYRILKDNSFCVSFYGWNKADKFLTTWRSSGFRIVGHLTFPKSYTSSSGFLQYQHESAYLLAKGNPSTPKYPIRDVLDFPYTGNKLHPTQKSLAILKPLIAAFSEPDSVICDPFCGSGSSLLAAKALFRNYIGIELDKKYAAIAQRRLESVF